MSGNNDDLSGSDQISKTLGVSDVNKETLGLNSGKAQLGVNKDKTLLGVSLDGSNKASKGRTTSQPSFSSSRLNRGRSFVTVEVKRSKKPANAAQDGEKNKLSDGDKKIRDLLDRNKSTKTNCVLDAGFKQVLSANKFGDKPKSDANNSQDKSKQKTLSKLGGASTPDVDSVSSERHKDESHTAHKKSKYDEVENSEEEVRDTAKLAHKVQEKEKNLHRKIARALVQEEEVKCQVVGVRKRKKKVANAVINTKSSKIVRKVKIPDVITVRELAHRMSESIKDVVRYISKEIGNKVTDDSKINHDIAELVVSSLGHTPILALGSDVEKVVKDEECDDASIQTRAPIITIMGHVDHGKTSLLDAIRSTRVAAGESGGITQHIGAYQVKVAGGGIITFIDTPGHEAFTSMRARGAQITDIVVLVVAADDGIKEQTVEAINHIKAAGVPVIVAINKIDKNGANEKRVKEELLQHHVVAEEFGGDVIVVPVSAMQKTNLDKLEEAILLRAEMMDLKASTNRSAVGVVVESKIDHRRGNIVTLLVRKGTLKVGTIVVAGRSYGKIKSMVNDCNKIVKEAGPSVPVEVLGFSSVPESGDTFAIVENDRQARDIVEYREDMYKKSGETVFVDEQVSEASSIENLDNFFSDDEDESSDKIIRLVIKCDVHGSMEAISASIQKLESSEVKIKLMHSAVGGINGSDVALAKTSGATIVGFRVRADDRAKGIIKSDAVDVVYFSVIYDVIDHVKSMVKGVTDPVFTEDVIGQVDVREVFSISKQGKVFGCYVLSGMVRRSASVRVLRDNIVIHEGSIKSLRRYKDDVKEAGTGFECGISLERYEDVRVGDRFEIFVLTQED